MLGDNESLDDWLKGRNPSLMRAGFHLEIERDNGVSKVFFYVSQSLVNEGRFPLDFIEIESKDNLNQILSQSLVNEGRFPPKILCKFEKIMGINYCRNPSLMRAGFH